MTKEEVLHYFQDINYMYNDCGMQDTLSKCLDEYADEIRADAIDDFVKRLCDYLGITEATKYGNQNAEQQHLSYSTYMSYEIKDAIDDVAEQIKE